MRNKAILSIITILLTLLIKTSYADDTRTWTENQIKNVIYNYGITHQQSDTNMQNFINNIETYITQIKNAFNQSHNNAILFQNSNSFSNMVFLSQNNTSGIWYVSNNRLYSTNTNNCTYYIVPTSRDTMDK